MKMEKIITADAPIAEAWEQARQAGEPRFVAARPFVDDRGWSLMNQMQGVLRPEGQINFSHMHPGLIKAWHHHTKQTDFWMITQGHAQVGVHDESHGRSWSLVTGVMNPGVVIVPPPLWHGVAAIGPDPVGLLYYVTHAYNPADPDEFRRDFDSVVGFEWGTQNR